MKKSDILAIIVVAVLMIALLIIAQFRINLKLLMFTMLITAIAICASLIAVRPKGKFHIKPLVIGAFCIWVIAILMSCSII